MDLTADPAALGWPPSLPLDLALAQQPVREICSAYGIDNFEYERLKNDHCVQPGSSRSHRDAQGGRRQLQAQGARPE